jgi:hypothetical protein
MDAELNPAQRLHALGQSLWLDSINRVMLRTGVLARYVRDLAVTGLTSNPTILGHAMAAGSDYDGSLARLAGDGVTDAQDLVYALALEDLTEAAALFRPEWEHTEGVDGYVSLEVPPDVAYDAAATVALARRLHDQAGFPNLLVKIPGTPQGLTAMEEAITAGIGVNVTLLFSDTHYLRTADAYLRALARWAGIGLRDARLGLARWGAVQRTDGLAELTVNAQRAAAGLPPPRLLGAFDPLLLGWASRDPITGLHQRIVTVNGLFRPFALAGGRAVATWTIAGGQIALAPFAELDPETRAALDTDAADVTRFLSR